MAHAMSIVHNPDSVVRKVQLCGSGVGIVSVFYYFRQGNVGLPDQSLSEFA